jgi:2-C-methyl-D-erythritol 4-phosphate cytidylyltransferase / 2-C-methyl-D-erythritol 2,4-cyclodiphosphate synthase
MSFKMIKAPARDTCAIIVAGGSGSRAGALPKQFQLLGGKPMVNWSVEAMCRHDRVANVIVVHPPLQEVEIKDILAGFPIMLTAGGSSRTESVKAGLDAITGQPRFVLIHDAARPGVNAADIDQLLQALEACDGAAPALAVSDSLKRTDADGFIVSNIDRSQAQRSQTPQGFRLDKIKAAYDALGPDQATTDDLTVAADAGCRLRLIPGAERLDKVTYAGDFERLERLLLNPSAIRTGSGFDAHAFGPGDHVWLCGVKIPHPASLIGHSDSDAPWHALTDAILGAIAEGDIGDHFSPSDEQWRGMSSEHFLRFAAERVKARGGAIINVDITIICEAPKVKPLREAMRARTAEVLGLDIGAVSVKATTTEGLGFLGRREGLAAQATVNIRL